MGMIIVADILFCYAIFFKKGTEKDKTIKAKTGSRKDARTCVSGDFKHQIALATSFYVFQISRCFVGPPRSGARTCVVLDFKHAIVMVETSFYVFQTSYF